MDTNDLSFVKTSLDAMRPVEWLSVAEKSGVPIGTLRKVAYGEVTDPRFWTVKKLADYFRASQAPVRRSSKKEPADA